MKAVYEAIIKLRITEEMEDENAETESKEYLDDCIKEIISEHFIEEVTSNIEIESTLEVTK